MQFKGEASVSWSEEVELEHYERGERRHSKTTETRIRSASELYFDQTVPLLDGPPDALREEEEMTLPEGRHIYPFSFHLPRNVPSSFTSKHGSVSYMMKAVIRRPSTFDYKMKKDFTIIGLLDLNLDPQAELASEEKEEEHMLCCLCCKSGPIVARLRLQRMGHILGEPLQFYATINNNTNRTLDDCELILNQRTTYLAEEHTEYGSEKTLCQVSSDNIEPWTSFKWTGSPEPLVIPSDLPPSKLPGCSIMEIEYFVTLMVNPTCGVPVTVTVPLTIGTLPSYYAVTGEPPVPCRPIQMTPQVGYSVEPPPLPEVSCQGNGDSRTEPSAPAMCEMKTRTSPYGGSEDASALAEFHSVRPSGAKQHPEQPPPSYEEYVMSAWSRKDESTDPGFENRV